MSESPKKPFFIFDCDAVLLDWHTAFSEWLTLLGYHLEPGGPKEWDLGKWIGCSQSEADALTLKFNVSPYFAHLKPVAGAVAFVTELKKAGYQMGVLSAAGVDVMTRRNRKENIERVFGFNTFSEITLLPLGERKFKHIHELRSIHHSVVFIDDNYKEAMTALACGAHSYCPRRSHNRSIEEGNCNPDVNWFSDYRDIYGDFGLTTVGWAIEDTNCPKCHAPLGTHMVKVPERDVAGNILRYVERHEVRDCYRCTGAY